MKRRHIAHFVILLAILAGGVGTFFYVGSNTTLQLVTGIVTAVSYVAWGLIHHAIEKDLHQKVVVEYVLIGTIAIVLLVTVLGF